jgi:hypothetical protein
MHIYGWVLTRDEPGPDAAGADTQPGTSVRAAPVAGATVRVHRNLLVHGVVSRQVVAETTADAGGRYDTPALPGDYYVVTATAPAGSPLVENYALAPLEAEAQVNVYLGRAYQFEPSPDTNPSWNLETRLNALEAFRGERGAFDARWTLHTVEGAPVFYALHVDAGRAVLEHDRRRDGGAVQRFELTSLELVRYVPSVWANGRVLAPGYLLVAEPKDARAKPGMYRLRGRCAAPPCEQTF